MSKLFGKHLYTTIILLSIGFSLFLYKESLNYYFFQDDFYEILISKAHNFNEFLKLFAFLENRSSYRPIGLQLYFFLSQTVFGLNPFLFRSLTFVLFFSTCFLIISSIKKMFDDKVLGLLTASFWVTSSIHFLSLSWIAAAWLLIGSFFFFLTLNTFLNYLQKPTIFIYFSAVITFLLTLGSFEFFASLPILLFVWMTIIKKYNFIKAIKILSPFIIVTILCVLTRLTIASLPSIYEYEIAINLETVKNFIWYFIWTLNIPEEFKKQIVSNLFILNPVFSKEFRGLVLESSLTMMLILLITFYGVIKNRYYSNRELIKFCFFCLAWFAISIIPVVIFPNHSFSMYLAIPSIGIYLLISNVLVKINRQFIIFLVLLIWFISSYSTVNFYRKSHWVHDSQNFAKKFAVSAKEQYPTLPKNAVVIFPNSNKIQQQAILNENAIRVIYNDKTIRLFFNEEELNYYAETNNVDKSAIFRLKTI